MQPTCSQGKRKGRKYSLLPNVTGFAFRPLGCSPAITSSGNPNTGGGAPPTGTAFSAGPGKTLTNIHVQLIFWGAWWNNNPLAAQVGSAVANLLAGPYMSYLAQYGVHRGNVRGTTFANNSEPGTFSYQSVSNLIQN